MRRWIGVLLAVSLCLSAGLLPLLYSHAQPAEEMPSVTAMTAVLMDARTQEVLYDKHMMGRRYPASITKIMTGWLSVESLSPGQMLTVSETALDYPKNGTNIALGLGETISVEDALYALMLPSANDAANVLAEAVDGTQEAFVERMNQRAREVGAVNTNFTNAHGLHNDNHYTTAYDMALITLGAIQNDDFLPYFGAQYHTIPATNLSGPRNLVNLHYMLVGDMGVYYPDAAGGKIGFTTPAQHTMVTAAVRDGQVLICVVMGCGRQEKFADTKTLLDYGFRQLLGSGGEEAVPETEEPEGTPNEEPLPYAQEEDGEPAAALEEGLQTDNDVVGAESDSSALTQPPVTEESAAPPDRPEERIAWEITGQPSQREAVDGDDTEPAAGRSADRVDRDPIEEAAVEEGQAGEMEALPYQSRRALLIDSSVLQSVESDSTREAAQDGEDDSDLIVWEEVEEPEDQLKLNEELDADTGTENPVEDAASESTGPSPQDTAAVSVEEPVTPLVAEGGMGADESRFPMDLFPSKWEPMAIALCACAAAVGYRYRRGSKELR